MSRSLLSSCIKALPEPAVKNTFLHFNTAKRELKRFHTSPADVDSVSTELLSNSPSASAAGSSSTCSDLTTTECLSPRDSELPTPTSECFSPRISGISTPEECLTPPPRSTPLHLQLALALVFAPKSPEALTAPYLGQSTAVSICASTGSPSAQGTPTTTFIQACAAGSQEARNSITLRRDDKVPLGLDLAADEGPGLRVDCVVLGGAAEAWNKQCRSDTRQILPGDRLLSVNAAATGQGMRDEAQKELLLRLTLQRGPNRVATGAFATAAYNAWLGGVPEIMPQMMPYVAPWPVQEGTGCAEPWAWQRSGGPAVEPEQKWKVRRFEWAEEAVEPERRSKGTVCRFAWAEDGKRLVGKGSRVTKAQKLECGEFTFTIHAQQTSDEHGGSSFWSSNGHGTVHVKCNSYDVGELSVTVSLADGSASRTVTHDFACDSICRIPEVFDFSNAVDAKRGTFTVVFELRQAAKR